MNSREYYPAAVNMSWYNSTVKILNWLIFEKRLQVFIASTVREAPLKKSGSPVYTNLRVCPEIDPG